MAATAEARANVTVLPMAAPPSWEDSVRNTLATAIVSQASGCGGTDVTQVIGSLAQNLNQQNLSTAEVDDAARSAVSALR